MISNLGGGNADISFESYIKVVLSSLWLIFSYIFIALGVTGILSAPYFMYSLVIKKRIYNKNKDINDKIDELTVAYIKERDKFHEEYRDDEKRESEHNTKLREDLQAKKTTLRNEVMDLLKQKDFSVIWKTYLMFAPLLIVYIAFVIPLILIIIDLTFKTASAGLTLFILTLYFIGLVAFVFSTYSRIYREERSVEITYL